MKKKWSWLLVLVMVAHLLPVSWLGVSAEPAPMQIGYVSPRLFAEYINASIGWYAETGTVIITGLHTDGTELEVRVQEGVTSAVINNLTAMEESTVDIASAYGAVPGSVPAAYTSETNNFYIPLRFIANTFGVLISFNNLTHTYTLNWFHQPTLSLNASSPLFYGVRPLVMVPELTPVPTPAASIDFVNEWLTNLESNRRYDISGTGVTNGSNINAGAHSRIAIHESWLGKTVSIEAIGIGGEYDKSTAQALPIPPRPAAPNTSGISVAPASGHMANGSISGVHSAMEWRLGASQGAWTSVAPGSTTISGLAAGVYHIRTKATQAAFASLPASVTVSSASNHTVVVNNSFAASAGGGSYAQGATVTIHAGSRVGFGFSHWTVSSGSNVVLNNINNATTSFVMPGNNVTVAANWTQLPPSPTATPRPEATPTPAPAPTPETVAPPPISTPPPAPVQPLVLNVFTPPMEGVRPFVMVQVDAQTKIGAISPRVFTNFIGGTVDFVDGVAILRGLHKETGGAVEVTMTANATTATVNGVTLDIADYSGSAGYGSVFVYVSESNNFYVPLRFMTKAFGYDINWNPITATATIE
jgi:hypothetical protein